MLQVLLVVVFWDRGGSCQTFTFALVLVFFFLFPFVTKKFLPLSPVLLLQLYTFPASCVEISHFLGISGNYMYVNQ